jgi:hypothetical protein
VRSAQSVGTRQDSCSRSRCRIGGREVVAVDLLVVPHLVLHLLPLLLGHATKLDGCKRERREDDVKLAIYGRMSQQELYKDPTIN